MNKKLAKIKQIGVVVLSLVFAQLALPVAANAAISDWLSGGQIQTLGSLPYISAAFQLPKLGNDEETGKEPAIVQGNFLAAQNSPQKPGALRNRGENPAVKIMKELVVGITAYSSTPDQTDDSPFITANGTYVRDGIVAANFLPFGTKIKIPELFGDKIFVVEDRMNRRYWHKVDIWFPDRESALEFGFKTAKIQIVES